MAELRAQMREGFGGFVTREGFHEGLRLHVDARVGAIGRWWSWAMNRACWMLTQKPRHRIDAGSACSATCWTTSRAQASELV